jgi:sialate O-acetylesterase
MKKIFVSLMAASICCALFANVRLPAFFGNNMILQRNKAIPVWGWADANETVTVRLHHQTKTTRADQSGKWMIKLDNEAAGGPYQLVIEGKNTITYTDVLVGDVWICSGQSNMEMPIAGWGQINNYQQEIAAANYPMIRHFKVPPELSASPKDDILPAQWQICSPATAGDFTAAGYFFARELYEKLKIPIGLLNTSWGGTMVETWISRQAFENSDEFKSMIAGMPFLNLDSLSKVKQDAVTNKIKALQGSLAITQLLGKPSIG